jgi:Protein of unknown function (DUF2946)
MTLPGSLPGDRERLPLPERVISVPMLSLRVNLARCALLALFLACGLAPLLHPWAHIHTSPACRQSSDGGGPAIQPAASSEAPDHCPLCALAQYERTRPGHGLISLKPELCRRERFDSPTEGLSTAQWGSPPARAPPLGL